jgi:RNA polymerase sigma factor (sigma-70 family)
MKSPEPHRGVFVTTRWTRVLLARGQTPEASRALGELCEAYYAPVFAFIRCSTPNEELARDLTHDFFARLLARDHLAQVDPARGRFRSYLLAAVKNFLRDAHARQNAAKRNPGQPLRSLQADTSATTAELEVPDPRSLSPEREFDRKWALAVLERALSALEADQTAAGKAAEFHALKPWLTGDAGHLSQAEVALRLNLSDAATRVAIHRLRHRFRASLKSEIAATLHHPDPALIQEELLYLITILT